MKKIAIMGSTGSIGTQALDIVRENVELQVVGLGAGKNIKLLEEQVREFCPSLVTVRDKEDAEELRVRLADRNVRILWGMDGLIELAAMPESELFLTAIVGMIGIRPTLAAIEAGKDIALSNKETLVTAGHLIMPLARKKGVRILPVDSEHSAIYQCLQGTVKKEDGTYPVSRIWLTASGGPFLGKTTEELKNVTVRDALKHPNWDMGVKVTIDSASLVNKGLEVMEARWLFDVPIDRITVIVQPKSIIHSMVEFEDGAVIAQMGVPDMHLPIQYALLYGKRVSNSYEPLDFTKIGEIVIKNPDTETFRGLPLAIRSAKAGGSMPTVFNAANEAAVRLFAGGKISFLEIYDIIESAMDAHTVLSEPSLDEILGAEAWTHNFVRSRMIR